MKALLKYWPALVLLVVVIAIAVAILITGQNDGTHDSVSNTDNSENYSEADPEQVTIRSEDVSSIKDALPGFNETTDDPTDTVSSSESSSEDTSDTDTSTATSTDSGTHTSDKTDTNSATTSTSTTTSTHSTTSTSTSTTTDTTDVGGGKDTNTNTGTEPDAPAVITNIRNSSEYSSVASGKSKFPSFPKELMINGVKCALDESSNTYCYAISERAVNVSGTYCFSGTYKEQNLSVVFRDGNIQANGTFKPKANQTMKIRVFTDKYYNDYDLRISTMPVMVIETENRTSLPSNNDKTTTLFCSIEIHNPDADIEPGDEFVASYATIHNRGASSLSYPKKSLKIELQKFENQDGNTLMTERKKRLLGMRDDDDWILDACYADPTMMHNKMAYNLWEEIGGDTNPDALLAGPHCEYVEVIMNGKYHGLFLLVEPVDEKQMGVDKSDDTADGSHGVFIKTTSWTDTKFDKVSSALKPTKNTWNGFEMKYPENNITAADWNPLNELLTATANDKDNGDHTAFINAATKYLDKENIVNYWILISVTLARDNAGKNICWSISNLSDPNAKMYINVWDMDNTFGYRYGVPPVKDPVTTANYADAWFKLLRCYLTYNVDGSTSYLGQRWAELTKNGAPCSVSALHARIDREAAYLDSSGAFLREQARWPAGAKHASLPNPLATEVEYAKQWIADRIPVVNKIVTSYTIKLS